MNRPMTADEKAAEGKKALRIASRNIGREQARRTALPPEYNPDVGLLTVNTDTEEQKRIQADVKRGRSVLPPGDRE